MRRVPQGARGRVAGIACLRQPSSRQLDHKRPLSKGGAHVLPNLQWLCVRQNQHKRDTDGLDYRWENDIPSRTPWDA